jgi:hypothetical protein
MPTKKKAAKAKKASHIGRPPKYNQSYAKRIVDRMRKGFSLTAAAGYCNVHRQTVYDWEAKHPEFSDAIKLGRDKRAAFLEIGLIGAPDGPTVTSRIFALKNAAPHEFREKVDFTLGLPDVTHLSREERDGLRTMAEKSARLIARSSKAGG